MGRLSLPLACGLEPLSKGRTEGAVEATATGGVLGAVAVGWAGGWELGIAQGKIREPAGCDPRQEGSSFPAKKERVRYWD